ncbi:LysR family transcriptional regulator [Brevundimonas sp.]
MDTEDLRTFVEVADAGGVSAAARRLGVAKSIVSRRLLKLEGELGVQLLARSTRGAVLTEAGETFRDYAYRIAAEADVARETLMPEGELRGRLRISAPLTFGPTHLAPILAEMGRLHPQLSIQTCYTDRFVDLVDEGYDCAIRIGYLPDSNLVARRIGPLQGKMVASPDYIRRVGAPETPDEVAGHEALLQGTELWRFMDGDKLVTVRPQGRFKADHASALAAAAVAGLGLARLPDDFVDEHIASGALVAVMCDYPPPPAGAYVLRPPGQHPARKIRVLTELLMQYWNDRAALAVLVATGRPA